MKTHTVINILKIFLILALVSFSAQSAFAFTAPAFAPTAGNVAAPINTGNVDQVKVGGGIGANFFVGFSGIFRNNYSPIISSLAPNILEAILKGGPLGDKGITITPNGDFLIKDGNQGAGKVLVSDANGVASWQSPGAAVSGLPPGSDTETLRHNGTDWVANGGLLSDGTAVSIGSSGSMFGVFSGSGLLDYKLFVGRGGINVEDRLTIQGRSMSSSTFNEVDHIFSAKAGILSGFNGLLSSKGIEVGNMGTVTIDSNLRYLPYGDAPSSANQVLASDASGFARWADPATLGLGGGTTGGGTPAPLLTTKVVTFDYTTIGGPTQTASCPSDYPVLLSGGAMCDKSQLHYAIPDSNGSSFSAKCSQDNNWDKPGDVHRIRLVCTNGAINGGAYQAPLPPPAPVWVNTTGQGNPGETCDDWLARTGQAGSRVRYKRPGSGILNYTDGQCAYQMQLNGVWLTTGMAGFDSNTTPSSTSGSGQVVNAWRPVSTGTQVSRP